MADTTETRAIEKRAEATVKPPTATLAAFIESKRAEFAKVLPREVDVGRFLRIVLSTVSRSPKLLECTPESILRGIMQAAQLGLEVGSPLGEAHLVPFKNRHSGKREAVLVLGYQGLVELVTRTGRVVSVDARVVRASDVFEFQYGTEPKLRHVPNLDADPDFADHSDVRAAYVVIAFATGERKFEVMSVPEIERIRRSSRAADEGPWVDWWDQQACKTVLKRGLKYVPKSAEMADLIAQDNRAERGETEEETSGALQGAYEIAPPPTATDRLAARARGQASPQARNGGGEKRADGAEAPAPPAKVAQAEVGGQGGGPVSPHTEAAPVAPSAGAVASTQAPPVLDRAAALSEVSAAIEAHGWGEAATVKWKFKTKSTLADLDDAELADMLAFVRQYDDGPDDGE